MKNKILVILIVFIFASSALMFPKEVQQSNWKGKIETKEGVTVVSNPKEPLYGVIELELEEDLVIGEEGDEKFRFFKWISLDVDRDGNIYVMDRGSFRIQKFNKKGDFIQTIGREGQGPGEFSEPTFISLDEKGNIYVKDGAKVQIFDRTGHFVRSFLIPFNSNYFKITSEGNFLGEKRTIMPPDNLHEGVVLMDDKSKVLMDNIKSRPSARQEARAELEKKVLISKFRPFFDEIRMDENGFIYAEKLTSYLSEDKGYEFDLFNEVGHYLYRLKVPAGAANLKIIKWGYVFCAPYSEDIGYFQVKRYKIKNWDQIKKGL